MIYWNLLYLSLFLLFVFPFTISYEVVILRYSNAFVSLSLWLLLNNPLYRPTMIKYKLNNIRELVGHKVNLEMVYKNPLCRLDK